MTAGAALERGAAVTLGLIITASLALSSRVASAQTGDDAPVTWGTTRAARFYVPLAFRNASHESGSEAAEHEEPEPGASSKPAAPIGEARSPPPRTEPQRLDEIRLRDGRQIRGRIVERAPGHWIVIETEDGHRRTFSWDTIAEVDTATESAAAPMPAAASDAWKKRSGGGPTYEVRAIVSTLSMPDQTFRLTGTCSTGSGEASVSMYGQSATDNAVGLGGGIGGRMGFMYRSLLNRDNASSWYAFRVGSGLDLQVYHQRTPVGIPPVSGELCSDVAKTTHDLRYEGSSFMLMQIPFNIGGHVALGKVEDTRWGGVVLGAAWTPSFVHTAVFSSRASSYINPLGIELTVDMAVLHAVPARRAPEPHIRASFFFGPATTDRQPSLGTISIGAVWF